MGEESKARSPISARVSLSDPAAVSTLMSSLQGVDGLTDSAVLSVRGSKDMVVGLLSELGDRAGDISADISLMGNRPAQR